MTYFTVTFKYVVLIIKRKVLKQFIWFICLFLVVSCGKDDNSNIHPSLQRHFDNFAEEAAERGLEVDYGELGLEAGFATLSSGIIGQCQRNEDMPNIVTVDRVFWLEFTELEKERVIFHELGHCILNRGHTDGVRDDGTCESIMATSVQTCNSNYSIETREEYFDELFDN